MRIFQCTFLLVLFSLNSCRSQSTIAQRENTIVLVNTGNFNKKNIAQEIEILNGLNAKVIALDIAFPEYSGNKSDNDLIAAIERAKNVVLPSQLHNSGKDYYGKEIISVVSTCALPIVPLYVRNGFVSAEREGINGTRIPSKVMLWVKDYTGENYYHFSVVTAMAYDSLKAIKYIQSHPQITDVDFSVRNHGFRVFSGADLRNDAVRKADIEGKIVVMGFFGPADTDKFVSPLNTNDDKPDMYGMEYLARIIGQVLFQ